MNPSLLRSFARISDKGEAENAVLAAGFPHVYLFRPAYIYPVEPRNEPNFSYRLLRTVYPVFRVLFPNQVIRADDLARSMVDLVLRQTHERQGLILENRDIRAMVAPHVTSGIALREKNAISMRTQELNHKLRP